MSDIANKNNTAFSAGDIFYVQTDRKYNLYKLLAIDATFDTYHVLTFAPLDTLPDVADIDSLAIFVYHSPFAGNSFADATLLANQPIKAGELIGYHEYLRQTQDPEYYIPIAGSYFNAGLFLTDQMQYAEAIDAYSKAIDLIPQFYEAIDNRAFCKMDLALWAEAIKDFELSLQENPNSLLAEFSIGECYFNMGDLQKARQQFEIAHQIDANHEAPLQFLEKVDAILNK